MIDELISSTPQMVDARLTLNSDAKSQTSCLAFSPDSKLIATGQQNGTIRIWETATGMEWHAVPGGKDANGSVFAICFSPDGDKLVFGGYEKTVTFLDISTKRVEQLGGKQESEIRALTFSKDGKILALATEGGEIRLWDKKKKEWSTFWEEKKSAYRQRRVPYISSIAFDPNGKALAVGVFGSVVFLDLAKHGAERSSTQGFQTVAKGLTYAPDGKNLAGIAGSLVYWDSESGKESLVVPLKRGIPPIVSIAFSPKGDMLAMGCADLVRHPSYVHIWDVINSHEIAFFKCHQDTISEIKWSPDGKTLATCSSDSSVKLWDMDIIMKAARDSR